MSSATLTRCDSIFGISPLNAGDFSNVPDSRIYAVHNSPRGARGGGKIGFPLNGLPRRRAAGGQGVLKLCKPQTRNKFRQADFAVGTGLKGNRAGSAFFAFGNPRPV